MGGEAYSCHGVSHEPLEVMRGRLLSIFISLIDAMVVEGELEEDALDNKLGATCNAANINRFDFLLFHWETNLSDNNPSIDLGRVDLGEVRRGGGGWGERGAPNS